MSTILKALRRVEEERPATPTPARRAMRGDIVADAGGRPPQRRKRGGPNLALWGSLGAVVLLAALVWWRLPQPETGEIAEAQPPEQVEAEQARPAAQPPAAATPRSPTERLAARTAPAAVPTAVAPPAAAPPAEPDVPAELAEHLPPLGATLDVPTPDATTLDVPTPDSAPPITTAEPVPPPLAPALTPAVAIAEPEPAPAPPPTAPPVAVAKPSVAPRPAAKPAPVVAKSAPPLAPAAPSAPAVLVERTSWHPKPERRIAWVQVEGLATRELHEGDVVGVLVVKEIRPSAVVFQHGADTLQRRVGER